MSVASSNLWPSDLVVNVIRPVTILKGQAEKLSELTSGILVGEVTTVTGEKDYVVHRFDIVAPKLDGYRHRILTATHRSQFYPVVVDAARFRPKSASSAFAEALSGLTVGIGPALGAIASDRPVWPHTNDGPIAWGQDDFTKLVGEVLRSPEVRSVVDSLLALSNEKDMEAAALEGSVGSPA